MDPTNALTKVVFIPLLYLFPMMGNISTSLLTVGIFLFVSTSIANACSCIPPDPPKESLKRATAVFTGTVVNMDAPSGPMINSDSRITITFSSLQIWKGPDYKTLVLTTARSPASCGYPFQHKKEYLVYAYGKEDKLTTSICSRTRPIANAQEDFRDLGGGKSPTVSGANYTPRTFEPILTMSIIGIAIILMGIVAFVVRQHQEQDT